MSSKSKKKPRKTKLVPRMYVENEDECNTDRQMTLIKIVDVKTVPSASFEAPQTSSHLLISTQPRVSQVKNSATKVSLLKTSQTTVSQSETSQPGDYHFKTPDNRKSLLIPLTTKVSQSDILHSRVSQFEMSNSHQSHAPFSISVNVEVEEFDDEDRLQIDESGFKNQEIKMEVDDVEHFESENQEDTELIISDDSINFQIVDIKQERITPDREMEIIDNTNVETNLKSNVTIKTEKEDNLTKNKFIVNVNSNKTNDNNKNSNTENNANSNQANDNNLNINTEYTANYNQNIENNVNSKQVTTGVNSNQAISINVNSKQIFELQIPNNLIVTPNQYLVTEAQILEVCAKILSDSTNIADKILAIEARNIIGRVAKEKASESNLIENKIQYALDDWKNWTAGSRRPSPLLYKCYICSESWWYLSEYREHLLCHTESNIKVSVEETSVEECNIISYIDMVPEILDVEPNGSCWRCEKEYSIHKLSNRQSECYYSCELCKKQFSSCTALKDHEDTSHGSKLMMFKCFLCPHMTPTVVGRKKHMQLKHSVRTDLPIPASYKRCNDCGSKYFIYNMHNCRNKICSSQCNFCFRKFTHRLLAELHMSIGNSSFKCEICSLLLPKKCMELEHVLMHSTSFIFPYKCITCEDFIVFLDENLSEQHRYIKHKQKMHDKKKNYFDKVLVPISCILSTYESSVNEVERTAVDHVDVEDNIPEFTLIPEIKLEVIDNDDDEIKQEAPEELIVKEENISDEEYEDDIIRLNYEHLDREKNIRKPKIYSCRKCPFKGIHKAYKKHLLSKCGRINTVVREPKVYSCTRCNFQGPHSVYKEHLKTDCSRHVYINETIYTCTKCDTTYGSLKRYLAHFVCHNYKYQQCPVCLQNYASFSTLIIHLNSHVRQSYLNMYSIQCHDDASERSNQVSKCKKCSQEVTYEQRFVHWERHLNLNLSTKNVRVTKVPIVFEDDDDHTNNIDDKNSSGLRQDMLQVLIESLQCELKQRIRDCPQCCRTFNRNNDCKRHFIEHLLSDAYTKWHKYGGLRCQICGEQHRKADKYKRHMRDHGCLPIFQCEVCDKAFSDSSNFTKHKKVHNMKVLICALCGKKFQAKASLIKHMEMHEVSKPVSCDLCNREFPTDTLYRRHMRTRHDNSLKQNYSCIICKEKFYTCKEKWEHSWEVHKERKYKADCKVCGKSFRTLIHLKRHNKLNLCRGPNSKNNEGNLVVNTKTFHFDNSIVVWRGGSEGD